MSAAPILKVYTAAGLYIASCKYPEDAAALVALHGDGATIRIGHRRRDAAWVEGVTGRAGESYDRVASLVNAELAR